MRKIPFFLSWGVALLVLDLTGYSLLGFGLFPVVGLFLWFAISSACEMALDGGDRRGRDGGLVDFP